MLLHQPKVHAQKFGRGLPCTCTSRQGYQHNCTSLHWPLHHYCAQFQAVEIRVTTRPMSSNASRFLKNKSCVAASLAFHLNHPTVFLISLQCAAMLTVKGTTSLSSLVHATTNDMSAVVHRVHTSPACTALTDHTSNCDVLSLSLC